jgi:hypothetical protein
MLFCAPTDVTLLCARVRQAKESKKKRTSPQFYSHTQHAAHSNDKHQRSTSGEAGRRRILRRRTIRRRTSPAGRSRRTAGDRRTSRRSRLRRLGGRSRGAQCNRGLNGQAGCSFDKVRLFASQHIARTCSRPSSCVRLHRLGGTKQKSRG